MAKKAAVTETTNTQTTVTFGQALLNRPEKVDMQAGAESESEGAESAEAEEPAGDDEAEESDDQGEEVESDDAATEEESSDSEGEEGEDSEEGEDETEESVEAKPEDEAPAQAAQESKSVPLDALLAERRKTKALKKELAQLKGEPVEADGSEGGEEADPRAAEFKNRLTAISAGAARKVYKDFDEKYSAVVEASKTNPELLEMIENSDDPGETTYRFGEEVLYQQKWGKTRTEQHENVAKHYRDEGFKAGQAAERKKLTEKIQKKNTEPKNISNARAAGGNAKPKYVPKTFGQRL